MLKKFNNKILLVIFAILAVLVVIVLFYENKNGDRTFKSDLFTVDSAKVTLINIYPKTKNNKAITLVKTGKNWEIKTNNKTFPADSTAIQRILHTLAHIKAERVAGIDKSSWANFEITDTSSTHVVVEQDKETVADFRIGKYTFTQSNERQYRQNNVKVNSHIRVAGDDRVYVVDGFLNMMFSDQASQYRNGIVFRFNKEQLTKLTFNYPADSSFTLTKSGNKWLVNDQPADSAEVERYFNSIANTVDSEFADDELKIPTSTHKLKIEGNNMPAIEVNGVSDTLSKKYFINSTYNLSASFASSNSYLYNKIFASKNKFKNVSKNSKK
ncbi:MAG: DUF4340 domain-containing protein [Bacteroidetes bacterium]|nr:DUF4340 domain-containing protein [Bacteroidota bacterium]